MFTYGPTSPVVPLLLAAQPAEPEPEPEPMLAYQVDDDVVIIRCPDGQWWAWRYLSPPRRQPAA